MALQRVFSGIQPSGELSIGHYLGVMQHWLQWQEQYAAFFTVADLHAITVKQEPNTLRARSFSLVAWYLAMGVDPQKSTIFVQSQVPAHTELCWLLTCFTSMGALNRMTQFKDKAQQFEKNINVGLFSYPVLMAADILLYNTAIVPVGEDQKQHLELARDLAERFNHQYGPVFTIPEPKIATQGARIMSLQDPLKKMSKSDPNQQSAIWLTDTAGQITKKIKKAVTDSEGVVAYDKKRPGISNLVELYAVLTGKTYTAIATEYAGSGYGHFKSDVAECVVNRLAPIQARYQELVADTDYVRAVMRSGAEKAAVEAEKTITRVKDVMGLIG